LQLLVNIILVVNVFVCVALVAVVLLQRSEGGALGMGGGGGPSGFMTARGAGDLLTRTTWILAFVFFFLSITQTVLTGKLHGGVGSLVDHINTNSLDLTTPQKPAAPVLPAAPTSAAPPPLQAPAPQSQAPAQGSAADALSALSAPTIQAKAPPQPQAPPQTPEKK
jgi:preprotein translocase subunit SecG